MKSLNLEEQMNDNLPDIAMDRRAKFTVTYYPRKAKVDEKEFWDHPAQSALDMSSKEIFDLLTRMMTMHPVYPS